MARCRSFERRTINRAEKQQVHLAKHRSALPLPNQPACLEQTPRSSLQLHLFLVVGQQVHLGRIPPNRPEHLPLVGLANRTNLQPVRVAAYLVVHLLLDSHNNSNRNSQRPLSVGLVSRINSRVRVVVSSVVEHSGRISPQLDLATRGSGGQVSFAVIVTSSSTNWVV